MANGVDVGDGSAAIGTVVSYSRHRKGQHTCFTLQKLNTDLPSPLTT